MATSEMQVDAVPIPTQNDAPPQRRHVLDDVMLRLTEDDYKSIFFLLIDQIGGMKEFLYIVKKEEEFFKNKFLNIYYEFQFKEAMLIEIFGTMQKYELLKILGTCRHIFEKDKDTFTQINSQWKCLYSLCEQLSDSEVEYVKEKWFPDNSIQNVCCAEELFCHAFVKKQQLQGDNWQKGLAEMLKDIQPVCCKLIASFKAIKLRYYPLKRPTRTSPCGIAVIMNHVKFYPPDILEERPESDADADALKRLWESFGFTTKVYTNLNGEQVLKEFELLSQTDHSHYDAFVACYLSHGNKGVVYSSDCKPIILDDLLDIMANKCGTLLCKPKLFFVQACQGHQIQTGVGGPVLPIAPKSDYLVQTSNLTKNVALFTDVLMFNSSIEGFVSFREDRSWFIDALVTNMEKYGEDLTVLNIVTKVANEVAIKEGTLKNFNVTKCKQTPVVYETLRHELKLKKVL